jgi:hypothetical protein
MAAQPGGGQATAVYLIFFVKHFDLPEGTNKRVGADIFTRLFLTRAYAAQHLVQLEAARFQVIGQLVELPSAVSGPDQRLDDFTFAGFNLLRQSLFLLTAQQFAPTDLPEIGGIDIIIPLESEGSFLFRGVSEGKGVFSLRSHAFIIRCF